MFISFEGVDGAGKTTLVRTLATNLIGLSVDVVTISQPGPTVPGRLVRASFDARQPYELAVEVALLIADRAMTVATELTPALDRGAVVLADRYWHSHVYQEVRGADLSTILKANKLSFPAPDYAFWLDVPVDLAAQRRAFRGSSRGIVRQHDIAAAYERLAATADVRRVDGSAPVTALVATVASAAGGPLSPLAQAYG